MAQNNLLRPECLVTIPLKKFVVYKSLVGSRLNVY